MALGSVFISALLFNFARYFVCSGGMSYLALLVWPKTRPERQFSKHKHKLKQVLTEIKWSLSSCVVFSLVSTFAFFMIQSDWTLMYFELGLSDIVYFPVSIVLSIMIHDSYFFGIHLLLHKNKWLMKKAHSVHHQFRHPTPFSDICYHPIEAALQFLFFPLLLAILPIHPAALAIYAFIINFSNIIGHTGFEFFDNKFLNGPLGRIINNPTDHLTHHINPNINFGLYFNFWDRWLERRIASKRATTVATTPILRNVLPLTTAANHVPQPFDDEMSLVRTRLQRISK